MIDLEWEGEGGMQGWRGKRAGGPKSGEGAENIFLSHHVSTVRTGYWSCSTYIHVLYVRPPLAKNIFFNSKSHF